MSAIPSPEESPNYLIYKRVSVHGLTPGGLAEIDASVSRPLCSLVLQVFTGSDLVGWLSRRLALDEPWEAAHLAHLLAAHGYLFPIDDHALTVRNDNTGVPVQAHYAEQGAARAGRLRGRVFGAPPEDINPIVTITNPQESEEEIQKKNAEGDIKENGTNTATNTVTNTITKFISYCEQYAEYDAFLTAPEWPNPRDPLPLRRVRRWAFSLRELLQDPAGKEHFARFLAKEFSLENLNLRELLQDPAGKEHFARFLAKEFSLENLNLRELLQDPAGKEHFARFLAKEFSLENLKFKK
ncbi:putative regulator of g protein signaling, partial [Operophtera brumata]